MPGTSASGSSEIAIVDSLIIADTCAGVFLVSAEPTVYIGGGATSVLGANVEILNSFGVVVKPYGSNYEIAPGLSGGMNAVISYNIPTQANNYQYGTYTVNLKMFDSTGASWVVTKTVKICAPDKANTTRKYGSLSAKLKADCVAGKLYIIVDGVPTYNGHIMESQVLTGELEYPTSSELPPLAITTGNFAVTLFEGVYKLTGEICASYNYEDNVFVKVKYKIKKEHNVRCLIDECCVLSALVELQGRTKTDCTDAEKEATASTIVEALSLFEILKLAATCGEDPSEYVADLEKLLGCKCTCNCAEGTPIIGTTPSSDVIVEGCNVATALNGLTTTYTINNYEYVVDIAANGGALVVSAATLAGCVKTQVITFDITVVYSQIKTAANASNTEGDFWASVINKSLRDLDPACIGLTALAWQALSFPAKIAAFMTKFCNCCGTGCDATITNPVATKTGGDVTLTWGGNAYAFQVYLDGVLVATYLQAAGPAGVYTHVFEGAADGLEHTWIIEAYCSDKTLGDTETGMFQEIGCPTLAATLLTSAVVAGVVTASCPFNLTTVIDPSNPITAEWHSANNTSSKTIVSNPASVAGGAFWVFNKDAGGCYSPGKSVTVLCEALDSCTAPQNLTVGVFGANNFFVQFQSAAYPPPSNSYTVKRRLASAPDVGGSYTTIGTPVWNASLSRWVIADLTAVDNVLYVYRAISNCGGSEPSVDYQYINTICPTVTLYPTATTVAYSFVPVSSASTIYIDILDSTGTVLIDTDTFTPAFANPITGTFLYLTPGTSYKVRLRIVFTGTGSPTQTTCASQTVETDAA